MMQKPKNWGDEYGYMPTRAEDRYVDEAPKAQFSGLYDANGNALYRKSNPVGFETDASRKFK
jgi:hypothetical protein